MKGLRHIIFRPILVDICPVGNDLIYEGIETLLFSHLKTGKDLFLLEMT